MEIQKIKIENIKPHPKNPKKHEIEMITKSIKEMGYIEPIVVDENNVILAGHGRLKALKEIKKEEVEVIIKRGLTEEQKEKYLLLSNKLTEKGGWDKDLLKEFNWDFLEDVGWDSNELDDIFPVMADEKDDQVPEIPKKPKSKMGDIYQECMNLVFMVGLIKAVIVGIENRLKFGILTDHIEARNIQQ